MNKISIYDIAKILVEKNGLTKSEAEQFVAAAFDVIQEGLERDSLAKVKGLGTFKIIDVEARESVNVNTGERVLIESHGKVTFTPDAVMKELVNKPFSQFETVVLNDGIVFDDISEERPVIVSDNDIPEEEISRTEVETSRTEVDSSKSEDDFSQSEKETPRPKDETNEPENGEAKDNAVQENTAEVWQEEHENDNIAETDEHVQETDDMRVEEVTEQIVITDKHADEADEQVVIADEQIEETDDPVVGTTEQVDMADMPCDGADEENVSGDDTTTDMNTEEVPDNDEANTETRSGSSRILQWIMTVVAFVVLIPLSFYGGYRYGLDSAVQPEARPKVIVKKVIVHVPDSSDTQNAVDRSAQSDSIAASSDEDKNATSENAKTEKATTDGEENVDFEKYAAKDARVRTGAYRIVGTDRIWTVTKGQTLAGISRSTLGDGMSCYIEVYNDLTAKSELQEGQQIKIPKLKLKRKSNK